MEKLRILIVDDERFNLNVLSDLLKPIATVILAKNGIQAIERAEKYPPDLILLDIMMPEMDGYEVVRQLKSKEMTKDIPIIFISALAEVKDEEKGLLLGAVDYITKPFHPVIVRARVKNHLQLVRQRKLIENIALLDGLTEIPNRRNYNERFRQEWKRAVRNRSPLSLALLDVDCFKQYNDNYGHARGDDALKAIGSVLRQDLKRPADFAARFGGEEFVILLPDTAEQGASQLADSIRATVEELHIEHSHSPASKWVTVSIGGATLTPNVEDQDQALLEMADRMLYEAKKHGRNKVRWLDETN